MNKVNKNFYHNLGYLCSFFPSIAEVCRRLSLNRQQFNKYLNGTTYPSRYNMQKLCQFFGVSESEILFEPERFNELISIRRKPITDKNESRLFDTVNNLFKASDNSELNRYKGYYFRYYYSFSYPGKVIKSLSVIYEYHGNYFWKNIERIRLKDTSKKLYTNRYEGSVLLLANRIHIIEYETVVLNSITQMILYPCFRVVPDKLVGIQTGGPVRRGRKPGASKVVLEYIGKQVNLKKVLQQESLYDKDDKKLSQEILRLIDNHQGPNKYVFESEEI